MHSTVGKYIMLIGAALVLIGIVVYFFGDKFNWVGRLPGDIRIEGKGGGFYFPVVTCIIVSVILNLVIVLIRRFFGS